MDPTPMSMAITDIDIDIDLDIDMDMDLDLDMDINRERTRTLFQLGKTGNNLLGASILLRPLFAVDTRFTECILDLVLVSVHQVIDPWILVSKAGNENVVLQG